MVVLQDRAHFCQGRHPLLPPALHLRPSGGSGNSCSGSCSTERGGLFHLLVVLSVSVSYCVTDGDEPAKAPETKKKVLFVR